MENRNKYFYSFTIACRSISSLLLTQILHKLHETKSQIGFIFQVSEATMLDLFLTLEFSVSSKKKLPVCFLDRVDWVVWLGWECWVVWVGWVCCVCLVKLGNNIKLHPKLQKYFRFMSVAPFLRCTAGKKWRHSVMRVRMVWRDVTARYIDSTNARGPLL
jgi:hypothetical protein